MTNSYWTQVADNNGSPKSSMPVLPLRDDDPSAPNHLDVCQLRTCGERIRTIAFKGTGACCDAHFKAQHGHARISEWQQERTASN